MKNRVYRQNGVGLALFVSDIANKIFVTDAKIEGDILRTDGDSKYLCDLKYIDCETVPYYNVIYNKEKSIISIVVPEVSCSFVLMYKDYKNTPTGFKFLIPQIKIIKKFDLEKESKDFYNFEKKLEKLVISYLEKEITNILNKVYISEDNWKLQGKLEKITFKSEIVFK